MKAYIKDILTQKGMTQQDLADLLGVSRPSVSATISRPSFSTLERIAAALEVEPWQLLAPPAIVEELKQARAQETGQGVRLVCPHCGKPLRIDLAKGQE
jgi:transcriptional regulator with XRE-family HTH domain